MSLVSKRKKDSSSSIVKELRTQREGCRTNATKRSDDKRGTIHWAVQSLQFEHVFSTFSTEQILPKTPM